MRKTVTLAFLIVIMSSVGFLQIGFKTQTWEKENLSLQSTTKIAADDSIIRPIGNWSHGICDAVCVQENLSFIGDGLHVTILDISDKTNPIEISTLWFPGLIGALRVSENNLYVGSVGTFWIVDISIPTNPVKQGYLELGSWIRSMRFEGGLVYLAQSDAHLRIVNVSNNYEPEVIGTYSGGFSYRDVSVLNGYAYVAAFWNGLDVVNVTDPSNPTGVANIPDEQIGDLRGVCKSGDYILTTGSNRISILNVSNPSSPVILNSTEYSGISILAEGSHVFAFGDQEIHILDVSNPMSIQLVASVSDYSKTFSWNPFVLDGYAYVASYSHGLSILDATDPENAAFVGEYMTPYQAWGVQAENGYVFANEWIRSMYILDLSNLDPLDVSTNLDTYGTDDFVIKDNLLYADNRGVLSIYDVTDPLNPEWISNYDDDNNLEIWAIEVVGDRAYLLDRNLGLIVLDISVPQMPRLIATQTVEVETNPDVCVSSNKIYVSEAGMYYRNLTIFELSSSSITRVGTYAFPRPINALEFYKGYLYVGTSLGLTVLDTSNPTNVTEVAHHDIEVESIEVANNIAYLGCSRHGIVMLNVSDPPNLAQLGNHTTYGETREVVFYQGMIISAEYSGGIWVYEHDYDNDGIYSIEEYQAGEFPEEPDTTITTEPTTDTSSTTGSESTTTESTLPVGPTIFLIGGTAIMIVVVLIIIGTKYKKT
ncbi:MAG: hypothetical protein RTV72_06635 [Candidatus Thorarchaeota archaeon]